MMIFMNLSDTFKNDKSADEKIMRSIKDLAAQKT